MGNPHKGVTRRSLRVLRRVRDTLRRHPMLLGGEKVVVAVSGGPDSMALLHLLCALQGELSLRLHVVTVDHGIHRSSAAHAEFVRRTAASWGVPVSAARVDARARARKLRVTLEEAARALRYGAMTRVARRVGASHLAVAHTADDQAETVLLWLLRGAGPDGLSGMPAVRDHEGLRLIRPLADLWRGEVEEYLVAERVPWRVDPTNTQMGPLRNRIRHELLPLLARYNLGIKAVLRRLSEQASADAAVLDAIAAEAWPAVVASEAGTVEIDCARLRALPAAVQRRLAHRAIREAGGNIRRVAFVHVERVVAMADRQDPADRADLPGLRAELSCGKVRLRRARPRQGSRMIR